MKNQIKVGDIVGRISHSSDLLFKVTEIVEDKEEPQAILRGIDVRLFADSPLNDLVKKSQAEINKMRQTFIKKNSECMRQIFERRIEDKSRNFFRGEKPLIGNQEWSEEYFEIPGSVLHLDGDKDYLDLCLTTYSQLNIPAQGFNIPEKEQPKVIIDYLKKYRPDILVLTGHDGLIKSQTDFQNIKNYRNSQSFIEAVHKAREYEPGRDDLIIFAGACQSHYEALINAGANFASSPQRILIHAFDPVFIVEKLAYSSIFDVITVQDIIANTITGTEGIGGIETRGRLRLGYPKSPY